LSNYGLKTKQESGFSAELEANGQKIDLNTFVESFISQAIIGVLKSLRDVDVIETIYLKSSKKAESFKHRKVI
jgi:hypothetical protein